MTSIRNTPTDELIDSMRESEHLIAMEPWRETFLRPGVQAMKAEVIRRNVDKLADRFSVDDIEEFLLTPVS